MSEERTLKRDTVVPPSSLFVFWPGDGPPLAEEIRFRLSELGQSHLEADVQVPEETLWSFWLDAADRPVSYLVWCENISPSHLTPLSSVDWHDRLQQQRALQSKWMVGVEGPISVRSPVADFLTQLSLCEAVSRDWSPIVYDASSFRYRLPHEIRYLMDARTLPRASCLFSVHKVSSGDGAYWIHTHGLERAGIPDLELFDVPEDLVGAACELTEAVADLWIEFRTPQPQVPFMVGRGLEVSWRPWQAVLSERPRSSAGGWAYRTAEAGHAGDRAVLVAANDKGDAAPLDVLREIVNTKTTLFKTSAETARMQRLAKERWGAFGLLFAGGPPKEWRFAVKLRFPLGDGRGEHLWFEVTRLKPGRIEGVLLNQPVDVADLSQGDKAWHDFDRLSDWRIVTPQAAYDPETAQTLLDHAYGATADSG